MDDPSPISPVTPTYDWHGHHDLDPEQLLPETQSGTDQHDAGPNHHRAIHSDSQPSYTMSDDYLSPYARSQSKRFFVCMVILCILFIFMALPLYRGLFDDLLSWVTNGEVRHLSPKRRRIVMHLIIWELVVLISASAGITSYYVRTYNH